MSSTTDYQPTRLTTTLSTALTTITNLSSTTPCAHEPNNCNSPLTISLVSTALCVLVIILCLLIVCIVKTYRLRGMEKEDSKPCKAKKPAPSVDDLNKNAFTSAEAQLEMTDEVCRVNQKKTLKTKPRITPHIQPVAAQQQIHPVDSLQIKPDVTRTPHKQDNNLQSSAEEYETVLFNKLNHKSRRLDGIDPSTPTQASSSDDEHNEQEAIYMIPESDLYQNWDVPVDSPKVTDPYINQAIVNANTNDNVYLVMNKC
ncbi:unnamed protein product [Owenia fusiformis]|uniref:Uncharacterized protein n=1 Tax=Owenia fusiformis TaxID=6347 RepID=A0A8J1TB43_OWEFU|nr:unnamed protein product [Owenia fusiformis]